VAVTCHLRGGPRHTGRRGREATAAAQRATVRKRSHGRREEAALGDARVGTVRFWFQHGSEHKSPPPYFHLRVYPDCCGFSNLRDA
jgi:hypothetical protein